MQATSIIPETRDQKGMIHCGLVMVKSRVTPIKFVSIGWNELATAPLSIKVSMML